MKVLSLILTVGSLFLPVFSPAWAYEIYGSGSPIQGTPYDRKLAMAGVFDEGSYQTGGSETGSIEDLFWTAKSFRYASDGSVDHWQTARETEARHAGDCEDKAVWLFTHLKQIGRSDTRLVIGKFRNIDGRYHVWVTCTDENGNELILDPAGQKRPWKASDFSDGFYRPLYSFDGQNRYRHTS